MENKWFGRYLRKRSQLSALDATRVTNAPLLVFSRPAEATLFNTNLAEQAADPKFFVRWSETDQARSVKIAAAVLPIAVLAGQGQRQTSLAMAMEDVFPMISRQTAIVGQTHYVFYIAQAALATTAAASAQTPHVPAILNDGTSPTVFRICSTNACEAVFSPWDNDVSNFASARNQLAAPISLDLGTLFDSFHHCTEDLPTSSYANTIDMMCDIRMRGDALHYVFSSQQFESTMMMTEYFSDGYSFFGRQISNLICHALTLDFLGLCLGTAANIGTRCEDCIRKVLPSLLQRTIQGIMASIEHLDMAAAAVSTSPAHGGEEMAIFSEMADFFVQEILETDAAVVEEEDPEQGGEEGAAGEEQQPFVFLAPDMSRLELGLFLKKQGEEGRRIRNDLVSSFSMAYTSVLWLSQQQQQQPLTKTYRWVLSAISKRGIQQPANELLAILVGSVQRRLPVRLSLEQVEEWKDHQVYPRFVFLKQRQRLKQRWMEMLKHHIVMCGGRVEESIVSKRCCSLAVLQPQMQYPQLLLEDLTRLFFSKAPRLVTKTTTSEDTSVVSAWYDGGGGGRSSKTDQLKFVSSNEDSHVGEGAFGSIQVGRLGFSSLPNISIVVAKKKQSIVDRTSGTRWSDHLKAFEVQPDVLEVIAMTMLEQYGRWEEDPYILSPFWFWTFVHESAPNGLERVAYMEYIDKERFQPLYDWVLDPDLPGTSRDIVFERLNAYYQHVAFSSPIHLIMQDNHVDNVFIERDRSVSPRVAFLILIDQSMSCVSVPLENIVLKREEAEAGASNFVMQQQILQNNVFDNTITFFCTPYEAAGKMRSGSTLSARRFSTRLQQTPVSQ